MVALTFDDGTGVNTNEIIRILVDEKIKATFYLTGYEIESDYEAAENIVNGA